MKAWSEHPINALNTEIAIFDNSCNKDWTTKKEELKTMHVANLDLCEKYARELIAAHYIDQSEYRDLALLPYSGTLRESTIEKAKYGLHRAIFLCSEEEYRPLVLCAIINYLMYLYNEGTLRRDLLLDVAHLVDMPRRRDIYKYAKDCEYLREVIDGFLLHRVYQVFPMKAMAYYVCRLDKKIVC